MYKILVLHGPNLNLLGTREPDLYGALSLEQVNHLLQAQADKEGCELDCKQSNSESELITYVHQAKASNVGFIILNAAAFAHTSIALRDALLAVGLPFIEVHISNTFAREEFRRTSMLADIATGVIIGLGTYGYELALKAAIFKLRIKT